MSGYILALQVFSIYAQLPEAYQSAQKNWKRIRGFERLAEVITGVQFINGMRQDNGSVIVDEQYAA